MYVTVSLKIEIDASASLSDMESRIQQAGREGMKETLKQAIRQSEEQEKTCKGCGSEQVHTQGTKRRVLLTRFGRVEVPLRRLRCQQCDQLFRPAEHCLAEVHRHNVTPDLRELAALVGSSWPYETAAGVLKRLSGVHLSDERLRQLTNEHFPDALKVLDWPHLWRKIRDAVRALQPGKHAVRRAWRKEQYEVLLPLLWQGERQQALTHLQSLRPTCGEAPPLEDAIRYLETQRDWIGNYQRWQEQGYPVGSGLVERAVAVVINVRMKKRGMRWKRANATAVVALRVQQINADWQAAAA